jgi:PAS domain-containing protein
VGVGLALLATCVIGLLAFGITPESAHAVRTGLIATALSLFVVQSVSAFVWFREGRRRRETEGSLRNSESRMRAVLETAVDAIISIDEQGIVQRMNEAAERMFSYRQGRQGHNRAFVTAAWMQPRN